MLSAKSQTYEQEEGLRRGALKYVCKPFTPKVLVQTVGEILDEHAKGVE
jgi:DNA-binding response OmpR family regulator